MAEQQLQQRKYFTNALRVEPFRHVHRETWNLCGHGTKQAQHSPKSPMWSTKKLASWLLLQEVPAEWQLHALSIRNDDFVRRAFCSMQICSNEAGCLSSYTSTTCKLFTQGSCVKVICTEGRDFPGSLRRFQLQTQEVALHSCTLSTHEPYKKTLQSRYSVKWLLSGAFQTKAAVRLQVVVAAWLQC